MRILFICHKNDNYGFETYSRRSSGLYNSTSFIVRALKERGIHAHIVEVVDNNCIDREVHLFKPDIVVIEALWVVPEKFDVLKRFHPKVKWFIHLHSNMPFLALEGIAMAWVLDCAAKGIGIIANSDDSYEALRAILPDEKLDFLPNVYMGHPHPPRRVVQGWPYVDIGCFGALRPLKNHLLQALASIRFAKEKGKKLRFHINSSRIETGGAPVLKNLVQLFDRQPDAVLVHNKWHEPSDFINLLHKMDMGLQVSLTETFNVVTADYVTAGLPVVVSKEVEWCSRWCKAEDGSIDSIVHAMHANWDSHLMVRWNQHLLNNYSNNAQELWAEWVRDWT